MSSHPHLIRQHRSHAVHPKDRFAGGIDRDVPKILVRSHVTSARHSDLQILVSIATVIRARVEDSTSRLSFQEVWPPPEIVSSMPYSSRSEAEHPPFNPYSVSNL